MKPQPSSSAENPGPEGAPLPAERCAPGTPPRQIRVPVAVVLLLAAAAILAVLIPEHVLPGWFAKFAAAIGAACVATVAARATLALGRRAVEGAVWAVRRLVLAATAANDLLAARAPRGSAWIASGVLATGLVSGWLGAFCARAFTVLSPRSATAVGIGVGVAAAAVVATATVGVALAVRGRIAPALVSFAAVASAMAVAFLPLARPHPPLSTFRPPPPIAQALDDPTRPGPYAVRELRYGVGDDLRPEYGRSVELRTSRFDASGALRGWTDERTRYWGFGPDALPINGRAWVPIGPGPFPLVLLVHGLADMTVDSEDGFAYLAGLLATRGHVVASIDQNFLGSGWSRFGQLAGDERVRATLILAHLHEWVRFTHEAPSAVAGLADLETVALVGHSRGGEAVKVATIMQDADGGEGFRIRAVVALAPTANWDDRDLPASYLAMHGDLDNNVEAFLGRRAYHRVDLQGAQDGPGLPPRIKTAVYVHGANHAQFNAAWGDADLPWPSSLLERTDETLPDVAQRRVTKLYVSAFLDATLRGSDSAQRLLQDSRVARELVPHVELFSKYLDSDADILCSFDEDRDMRTATVPNAFVSAEGFGAWSEHDLKLRLPAHFGTRQNRLLDLRWDHAGRKAPARLSLVLPDGPPGTWSEKGAITFALGFPSRAPRITLRVVDVHGAEAAVPLSGAFPVPTAERLTRVSLLEDRSREIVLQTVVVPLSDLVDENPAVDLAELRRIDLLFDGSSGGAFLDDLAYTSLDDEV